MLSAAFAMLVCGCLSVLVPREKIPSIAETFTMCLSPRAVAQHQRLQPAAQDEGRHRVHELDLEHLGGGDLGQREAPGVLRAQVHLLQVRVHAAVGEEVAPPRGVVVGVAHLREAPRSDVMPIPPRPPCHAMRPVLSTRSRRGQRAVRRRARPSSLRGSRSSAARSRAGRSRRRPRLALQQVRVEAGRPPHGLAGVVDEDVQAVEGSARRSARRSRRSASGAGRGRGRGAGPSTPRSRARGSSASAASCGKRVVAMTRPPARSILSAAWKPIFTRAPGDEPDASLRGTRSGSAWRS